MEARITLLLNDRMCNFDCIYCYARHDHRKREKAAAKPMTDFHAIDYLYERKIEQAASYGEKCLINTTFWGGEPFFNPHLRNAVEYIRGRFGGNFFAVTNGSLITDRLADWLIDKHFHVNISNDLAYQEQQRGYQYLDMPEHSHAVARLCKAGLVGAVQTVLSRKSPDLMRQLAYLRAWAEKEGLSEDETPALSFLPVKAYSEEAVPLLFTEEPGDEASAAMVQSLRAYALEALQHPESHVLGPFYKTQLRNAYLGLTRSWAHADLFVKGDNMPITACAIFKGDHCFDLTGREWNCPHPFERDPDHPVILKPEPEPVCGRCMYMGQCNAVCIAAGHDARMRACGSLKLFYRTIREVLYENSDEEMRREYAPECVADLRGALAGDKPGA